MIPKVICGHDVLVIQVPIRTQKCGPKYLFTYLTGMIVGTILTTTDKRAEL